MNHRLTAEQNKLRAKKQLFSLGLLLFLLVSQSALAADRPNILYFFVDDMGWGSIGPNGQEARRTAGLPNVKTPNIDSLASAGVNFQRAYACTVCSPSRSSQQTGFHQGHTWADRNDTNNAKKAMRADDITMGDALSQAGYTTGYWGKWGYGGSNETNPVILNEQTLPSSHGYDYILAELHHVRAHTFFQPTLWSFAPGDTIESLIPNSVAAYANNPDYPESPANQSHPSYPSTAYCDDYYAFKALDFVRAQAQEYNSSGTPFFALYASQLPHAPFAEIAALPEWDEFYDGEAFFSGLTPEAKQWAAMVTRIDAHMGNILAALEDPDGDGDTSDSVVENTLVIFQSDNGGDNNDGIGELGANADLRGVKGTIWEGGLRVPLVMRWPANITPTSALQVGTNSSLVVDVTDLLATFCDLAEVETPLGIDGVSLAPTLTGVGHQRVREFIIHEAQPDRSIIRGDHKLVDDSGVIRLYNLGSDPTESSDIAGANPALVSELSTLLYGERVSQPQWSANTYHNWTGADGASSSDAGNWSDYVYQNVLNSNVYDTDTGAPRVTWVAKMENTGPTPATAVADTNLEFLALEVSGASATATQAFDVNACTITGRNEIRLSEHACVTLGGGTLNSLRWVDLMQNAEITGAGIIDAALYHAGKIAVTGSNETTVPAGDIIINPNGSFELGTGDSFEATDDWFNYGPDQTKNARNTKSPYVGNYRGIVGNSGTGAISPAVDTGYTIQNGDVFTLSFYHDSALYWDVGADTIEAILYYLDSGEQILGSKLVTPSSSYVFSGENSFNATAGSVGQTLMLRFESPTAASTGEWAAIDEVNLSRNGGEIIIPGNRVLAVTGSYRAAETATLDITLAGNTTAGQDYAQMQIDGTATLNGLLTLTVDPTFTPSIGDSFSILTASAIEGVFANPHDVVIGSNGTPFKISYSSTEVTLTPLYNGDLTFNGKVDLEDVAKLGAGWQTSYDFNTLLDIAADWLLDLGL